MQHLRVWASSMLDGWPFEKSV